MSIQMIEYVRQNQTNDNFSFHEFQLLLNFRFEDDNHEEESRSSKGGHSVGLPIQLRPSARGMPAPLVWISPASLARSPMVSLRKLETPTHNELFRSGNVERALTMTFPGRSTGRFNPTCLECMSLKHNSDECPPCFLSVR